MQRINPLGWNSLQRNTLVKEKSRHWIVCKQTKQRNRNLLQRSCFWVGRKWHLYFVLGQLHPTTTTIRPRGLMATKKWGWLAQTPKGQQSTNLSVSVGEILNLSTDRYHCVVASGRGLGLLFVFLHFLLLLLQRDEILWWWLKWMDHHASFTRCITRFLSTFIYNIKWNMKTFIILY